MKRVPRWVRIVLVLVASVVVLALVVPYFLDLDHYRNFIASTIEEATGRKVSIGKIRAKLLPAVGFVIEDFKLGHPADFAEGHLLAVDAVHGSLAWGPLLSREFQLSAVELVHPRVLLLEDDRGRTNYDFGGEKTAAAKKAAPAFRLADIDSIRLSDVELTLGHVAGRKRTVVPGLRAWNVNAALTDVALDPDRIKQWKVNADLAGVLLELPGLKGRVEFRSGNFSVRDGKAESKFAAKFGSVADVNGSLRVADIEKAVVQFDLNTPLIDLDQFAGGSAAPAPATSRRPQKSELVAQGRLTAARVRYAPYEGTDAKAEVRIFTDRIEMWPMSMALYGGTLQTTTRVDTRQSPERFSSNIQATSIDVGRMLAASPATRGQLTGTAELALQIFGSLGPRLLDSLSGTGTFAVRDGKLPSINLNGVFQTMAKVQQILTFGAGSGGFKGETTFSSITGDLRIGNGRVASNRIHLESPSGTVDLRGSFGFNETLDYDGQAVLMRSGSGEASNPGEAILGVLSGVMKQSVGRLSVPFAVRGTFSDPKIQPGRGLPGIETGRVGESSTDESTEEKKKKSIFNIFRKPSS